LLFLDPGQDLAQALVLNNGMTDALQLVEGRVRQRPAFPANLQPPIRKVIDLDHFAAKANCQTFLLKRQLHTTVVHHQLVRHLTLLTPTQNLIEILPAIDRAMKVLIAGRWLGKAAVVVGDEVGQKRVYPSGNGYPSSGPGSGSGRTSAPHCAFWCGVSLSLCGGWGFPNGVTGL